MSKLVIGILILSSASAFAAGKPESAIVAIRVAANRISFVKSVVETGGRECGGCANYLVTGIDLGGTKLLTLKVETFVDENGKFHGLLKPTR